MDRQPKPIALTFLVFCIGLKLDLIIPNHSHLRRSFMIILNKDNIFFSLFVKTPNQECVKQVHMLLNEEKWPFPLDKSFVKTNSSKGPAENRVPLLGWWVVGWLWMGQIIALCCFIQCWKLHSWKCVFLCWFQRTNKHLRLRDLAPFRGHV